MKMLLSLVLVFSTALAQGLPQQYASLPNSERRYYEQAALKAKPRLEAIESRLRTLVQDESKTPQQRLQRLTAVQKRLQTWVGESLMRYTVMLPLLNTVQAQRSVLAQRLPFRVPYRAGQIKAQFNVGSAEAYSLGTPVTLVTGTLQKGALTTGDKVIIYFKQQSPVLSHIKEDVSVAGATQKTLLLADEIPREHFLGGAVLLIPQS